MFGEEMRKKHTGGAKSPKYGHHRNLESLCDVALYCKIRSQTVQSNSLDSVLGYLVRKEYKYIEGKVSPPFQVQQQIKILFD